MDHSWDGVLFDHTHMMINARNLLDNRLHSMRRARETRCQCFTRDGRRREISGSHKSFGDSSSEGRFALNADRQQTLTLIINFKSILAGTRACPKQGESKERNKHTLTAGREKTRSESSAIQEPERMVQVCSNKTAPTQDGSTRTRPRCTVVCRSYTSAASGRSQD